jgi:hypothetical protein
LANLVGQLAVQQHHGSRVASKWSGTESVKHHVLVFHHLNFDFPLFAALKPLFLNSAVNSSLGRPLDDLPYGYGDDISRSLQILRTNKS